ncbi:MULTISPECIES: hypothetical protein [Ferrimonas]|uniref:hypothetical protein n=1 Tax=Ferrimonas TaxID=44011 RepID=UPI0004277001|nr:MULTISPECIES: hypothetical protein [Ferrimonas]USD38229.1 hypothetical protein J8Z22_03495 [Ferrimonas sp. SCSIO 43195]
MNQNQFRSRCLGALGINQWRLNAEYGETSKAVLPKRDEALWCVLGADPESPLLQDLLLLLQCSPEEVTLVNEGDPLSQGQRLLSFGVEHEGATISLPLWSELKTVKGKRQAWQAMQELL